MPMPKVLPVERNGEGRLNVRLRQDIKDALARQNSTFKTGDVVLIRTGRMKLFNDPQGYMANPPGMGLDAARYLVEESRTEVLVAARATSPLWLAVAAVFAVISTALAFVAWKYL